MSSVLCDCGHVIKDGTDNLPYKAQFLPDQNDGELWEKLVAELTDLVELSLKGKRQEWLEKHFDKRYLQGLELSDHISDYFSVLYARNTGKIYQCEQCGNLLVYRHPRKGAQVFKLLGDEKSVLRKVDNIDA
jgi:hypothetical protein